MPLDSSKANPEQANKILNEFFSDSDAEKTSDSQEAQELIPEKMRSNKCLIIRINEKRLDIIRAQFLLTEL